jgi:ABC-2 type transport system permease protein
MIARAPLIHVTLRGVLGRRRTWLMVLLVALPIGVALLIRLGGGQPNVQTILDTLIVRTVMPLLALVLGTSVLGSELEDGTAVYLMVKPVPRWRILLAKMVVAAGITAALVFPATVATALLTGGRGALSAPESLGFALAVAAGGVAYACAFVALSAYTGRALILGLCYVLIWEGILAGLLEGTRFLSIRQATLGLTASVTGASGRPAPLDPSIAIGVLVVVVVGAFFLGTYRLSRFEVRGTD